MTATALEGSAAPIPSLPADAVVVLVGAAASGKTTFRRALLAADAAPRAVLSLDDERLALRERDSDTGREPRPLQDYSRPAVLRCEAAAQKLLSQRRGYLADATHLRRRERIPHVRAAHEAGLPAIAVLLPAVGIDVLRERNGARPELHRVPDEILERHEHRRSLLSRELLLEEGFDEVVEVR
ncbi:AAA family ATPase [Naasia sp. SYSU D00948]|uniref:AAA family ATPase n=1 Tax=Naasia sp. SYSU D00948 TaxID=2817379 RepID=UPI001B3072DE|nr:AAA family ATPase [Naasia sp. SYSU D00948]